MTDLSFYRQVSFIQERMQRLAAASSTTARLNEAAARTAPSPARETHGPGHRGTAASCKGLLAALGSLSHAGAAGHAARARRKRDRAERGRGPGVPPVSWHGLDSLSAIGARFGAAAARTDELPAAVISAFSRYKSVAHICGEQPLPFTAAKLQGFAAVYAELWAQESASLPGFFERLERFAQHHSIPWLADDETASLDRTVKLLRRLNPSETSYAATVSADAVDSMLRQLDARPDARSNLWVLQLAALLAIAVGAELRTEEPTHSLVGDFRIVANGVYFARHEAKSNKLVFDSRTHTSRAPALPGSPRCPRARLLDYFVLAGRAQSARAFPLRNPTTGSVVLDADGTESVYTEYYYKRDFRELATAAGIPGAAFLSPRGMRSGGAAADRLSGLTKAETTDKGGWGAEDTLDLYARQDEIGLDLDEMARDTPAVGKRRRKQ